MRLPDNHSNKKQNKKKTEEINLSMKVFTKLVHAHGIESKYLAVSFANERKL